MMACVYVNILSQNIVVYLGETSECLAIKDQQPRIIVIKHGSMHIGS